MSKARLAKAVGVQLNGGGFRIPFKKLRDNGLVEINAQMVRLHVDITND